MLVEIIASLINIILFTKFVGTQENTKNIFERFKIHYHREYNSPSSEEEGYENFVKNLNVVNDLNKKHPGDIIAYQLNRFADLNPAEIKDHFALDILPYDHKEKEDVNQKKVPHKFIEDINLYDLNDVDDLYDRYLLKWSKQNHTMKTEDMAHYYRFVKTVVEVNEKRFAGEDVTLGPDADEIKEPNEFFYG